MDQYYKRVLHCDIMTMTMTCVHNNNSDIANVIKTPSNHGMEKSIELQS